MSELTLNDLSSKLREMGEAWESQKKAMDKARSEGDQTLAETKEQIKLLDDTMDSLSIEVKKIETALVELSTPEFDSKKEEKTAVEHQKSFELYLRSVRQGQKEGDFALKQSLAESEKAYFNHLVEKLSLGDEAARRKAVSIGTASAGGHAVPEVISRMIDKKLLDVSPILPYVKVVNVGTSDYKELVDTRGASGGWVGETDTRSATNTPNLQQVAPTMGIVYAYPSATEESMQDIFFDVQSWLIDSAVEEFERLIGIAVISGNGTNKPTGFLNGTPVDINDEGASPERAFGTVQYKPLGAASTLPPAFNLNSSPQITTPQGDYLLDIVYALKAGYRRNARWMMNKATLAGVRKFRNAEGDYIWQPGLQMGEPARLAGYPVVEMEDMPSIAANAFPIAFGDFRAAYTFINRSGTSLTIDDNITTPGYVKFYIRRRVGGILRNDDAIKLGKIATS